MLFAVLAYGAINDGQRLLFTGILVFFLAWVSILGFMLVMHETPSEVAEHVSAVANFARAPPKAPEIVSPANLPMMAMKGTSFHLEAGQSTPLFRVPVGTKISLLTCGADGEWHFGWLITQISSPPKKLQPVSTTTLCHGVLRVALSQR